MAELGDVAWPVRLETERLVLRATEGRDRECYLELLTSPDVRRYLGGPLDRAVVEAEVPSVPGAFVGNFAVDHAGRFVGTVQLDRRDPLRPGRTRPGGLELEIGYTFLPDSWGHGYAHEAVSAVLGWAAEATSDDRVLLCTQTANARSMVLASRLGFTELERFTEWGAEQWLGSLALRESGADG